MDGRNIVPPGRPRPGCAAWHICEEVGSEQAVILVDRWETRAALEAHLRSEAYRRVLGAIELSVAPPEIHFDTVSPIDAASLVESQRNPQAK